VNILTKLKSKLLFSIIFGVIILLVLSVFADINSLIIALYEFQWSYAPLILILTFFNYIFRFIKWYYYLKKLGININKKDSAIVFFSGLTMSITPGKFGEVLKSYLLKQLNGINISRSAPIVFAERLTDVIGLILLSSVGATIYKYGESILIATLICIALMILVIQSKTISLKIIGFSERIPIISNFAHNLYELYESAFQLLILKNLLIAVIISALSWFFECLAMYYTIKAFGLNISLIAATFVFAFSSIAGAVSMLPGGLGVAEGSMTGLLILLNIPKPFAVSATLIIRFCTLWFGVGIGMVTLFLFRKKFI